MAIIVETNNGYQKIGSGYQAFVNENGHLTIKDGSGATVAAFSSGSWASAVTEGDREFSRGPDFS